MDVFTADEDEGGPAIDAKTNLDSRFDNIPSPLREGARARRAARHHKRQGFAGNFSSAGGQLEAPYSPGSPSPNPFRGGGGADHNVAAGDAGTTVYIPPGGGYGGVTKQLTDKEIADTCKVGRPTIGPDWLRGVT